MTIELGAAFRIAQPPYHRCVILSKIEKDDDVVVLVRITTDDGTWPDRDCLIEPTEWSELDRTSTVAYSTANAAPCKRALERQVVLGAFVPISRPSIALLTRIIEAGRNSRSMPPLAKANLATGL